MMINDAILGDLGHQFAALLRACLMERKFDLPLHVALVAMDGTTLVVRIAVVESLRAELLAQHLGGNGLAWALNILITDGRGSAGLARLERPGADEYAVQH